MINKMNVIDVRTPEEFLGGHVANSINIPLSEISSSLDRIRSLEGDIILCCASGNRSGQAAYYLQNQGIACVNGGSWLDVNYEINK